MAVSNCTTALHLALLAAGVKPGDEVVTVSHSYIATANSVTYCGATPVFVDIDPATYNIDPALIEQALSAKTSAILVVHQMGLPCDMAAVVDIARAKGLPVIEDAACASGSEILWNGQWEKVGKSWDAFAKTPSGTGPWKLTAFVPHEKAELVPFKEYWDKARVPKLDKMVLIPLPEPNARVAALRSGQVDWIEAPSPDAVPSLKAAGFQIVTNAYPHNWTWHLSRAPGSPWNDIRVRKAANLAIDREGMKELLAGLMIPAEGFFPPGHQWFGHPTFKVKYDPAEAKKLLAEAGYGPNKPLVVKTLISASGSGQMSPLPMNEFIQQNLAEVGIKVEFDVVDWNQMINIWRAGALDPASKGAQAYVAFGAEMVKRIKSM